MKHAGKKTSDKKILLVEDSRIIQIAEKMLFEGFGLTVDLAVNGEQAIALFKPEKYAMVLLDIGLPDISGYEVCKHLIEIEKGTNFHAPIIGISAHVFREEKNIALEAGMEEMLDRPLLKEGTEKLLKRYGILN